MELPPVATVLDEVTTVVTHQEQAEVLPEEDLKAWGRIKQVFKKLLSSYPAKLSLFKLLITIGFVFGLSSDWTACRLQPNDPYPGQSFKSNDWFECDSYTISPYMNPDPSANQVGYSNTGCHNNNGYSGCSCFYDCSFGGKVFAQYGGCGDDYTECIIYATNECICKAWINTVFLVLLADIAHFVVQLHCLTFKETFDPQLNQIQQFCEKWNWSTAKATLRPYQCVLSFLEIAKVTFAVMLLFFDVSTIVSVESTVVRVQKKKAVFLVVAILCELWKPNIFLYGNYAAGVPGCRCIVSRFLSLVYFLRFDLSICYLLLQLFQTGVCGVSVVPFLVYSTVSYTRSSSPYPAVKDSVDSGESRKDEKTGGDDGICMNVMISENI
jgi:hypothetical protein